MPSERRITIDRGQVFDEPVPAVECAECGKMFAAERLREATNRGDGNGPRGRDE